MTNVPVADGGAKLVTLSMTVEGAYSLQFFFKNGGRIWFRYKGGSDATPGAWKETTAQGEITASDLHAVQYARWHFGYR